MELNEQAFLALLKVSSYIFYGESAFCLVMQILNTFRAPIKVPSMVTILEYFKLNGVGGLLIERGEVLSALRSKIQSRTFIVKACTWLPQMGHSVF